MNPDSPKTPREEMELRITALLLGELSAEEGAAVRELISHDRELTALHDRLKQAITLVHEAATSADQAASPQAAPLKMSEERREKLLAHFKTVTPKEFVPEKKRAKFTLVELAAAVAILGAVAAFVAPTLSGFRGMQRMSLVQTLSSAPEEERAAESAPEKNSPTLAFRTWGTDRGAVASSTPPAPNFNGVRSANAAGHYNFEKDTTEHHQGIGQAATPLPALTPPPSQIILPSITLADADAESSGAKVLADNSSLGIAGRPIANVNSSAFSSGTAPSKDGDHLYFAAQQSEPNLNTDPTTGLPVGTVVADGFTPLTTAPATEPPAQRFGGFGGFGGGGAGGGGGDGGIGGRGEVAGVRYNFVTNSVALANNSVRNSDELANYQVHAGFDTASFGVSSGRLSVNENTGVPPDANGNKVPVLGNLPVEGRLFRSAQQSSATTSPGFSLLGPTELPKLSSDTLTTSGANTFVGGAVVNSGTLTLGENRSKADGFNLNVAGIAEDQAVKVQDFAKQQLSRRNSQDDVRATLFETLDSKPDSKKVAMDVGGESSPRPRSSIVLPSKETDAGRSTVGLTQVNPMIEPGRSPARTLRLPGSQSVVTTPPLVQSGKPASEQAEELIPAGTINFPATDIKDTLAIYAELSGKTVLQPANLPNAQITLKTQTPLTKKEAIQALDGALALNGITMVPVGDKYVKAVPVAQANIQGAPLAESDLPVRKPSTNAPIPQPEIQTSENNFSTFSLNVSDVSFRLAAASLEKGQMPDPASIRSEEFINAFDYRDPEATAGSPIAFAFERARYPFAHNRDLLRFSLKTAAAGRQAGRPLNIVLLLDNSGSMERADRVQIIHEALRVLASQLQPQDKLSVITFARTARLFADGVSGDKAGEIAEQVSGLTPEGGTNLEDAMNLAYQTAAKHYLANGINRVVLLTDGAANLGDVEPDSLKQKVEAQRKQGIALDCFGIGWEGFNDDLLEVLSRNGDGRYGFINSPEEAATDFVGKLAGALKVAASDVKVQVEFNPKRVTSYRQIGYAKHQLTKEQFRDNTVDAAEIAAQEAGNALYTVEVNPAGDGPLCVVRVRYKIPGTTDYREQSWDVPYTGNALSLEQSSPAIRLAASASAFSEWLAVSPFAGEVTPDSLLNYLRGVPEIYGADARPKKLEWVIRQAKAISGQ
jgi:Mg-chelatase subunit ChlD